MTDSSTVFLYHPPFW